jgi:hypothetical protein
MVSAMPAEPWMLWLVLLCDYTTDLLIILLGLALVRKVKTVPLATIALITVVVMVGGQEADSLGSALGAALLGGDPRVISGGPAFNSAMMTLAIARAIGAVPFIFLVNFLLARLFFRTTRRESAVIGLLMAICTAPVLYQVSDALGMSRPSYSANVNMNLMLYERALVVSWVLLVSGIADAVIMSLLARADLQRRLRMCVASCIVVAVIAIPLIADFAGVISDQRQMGPQPTRQMGPFVPTHRTLDRRQTANPPTR